MRLAAEQQLLPGLLHLSQVHANKQRMRIRKKNGAWPITSATPRRNLAASPRRIGLPVDSTSGLAMREIGTRGDAPDGWELVTARPGFR